MSTDDSGINWGDLPKFRLGLLRLCAQLFFGVAVLITALNVLTGVWDSMLWTSVSASICLFGLWMWLRQSPKNLDLPAAILVFGALLMVVLGWFPFAGVMGSGPSLLFPLMGLCLAFTTRRRQRLAFAGIVCVAVLLVFAHLLNPEWVDPYYATAEAQRIDVAMSQLVGILLVGLLFLIMANHHLKGWEELERQQRKNMSLLQRNAQQLEEELRMRLDVTQRMGASLAHDVNNMLSVVLVSADLLEGEENEDTRQSIIDSTMTASHLVQRFRKSKAEQIERILWQPTLHSLVRSISFLASHIDVRLVVENEESYLLATRVAVEQVVMNLCLNAVHAMPEGGQLTVRLREDRVSQILEVRDTGTGIKATDIPHIFEPFFTTRAHGGGTGIGLSNVRDIVLAWGGQIRVESKEGEGTLFSIQLPITPTNAKTTLQ